LSFAHGEDRSRGRYQLEGPPPMHNLAPTEIAAPHDEAGMSTAEYCVGTVSACGFGGILYSLLTSDFGQNIIESIFDKLTGLLPF
jgi:hypothetical protein